MTVYFVNNEAIDLNAIAIMGVNVKIGSNPIGHFGTGLKYAIATLLRTGHRVRLRVGQNDMQDLWIDFTAEDIQIRGTPFQIIKMGEERMGWTTALGKNWEVWQAYRELYCNALDEQGKITDDERIVNESYGTIFAVSGGKIEEAHAARHSIFTSGVPIWRGENVEIYEGEGDPIFYRGVRAASPGYTPQFRYNILSKLDLTEDRTIKHEYMISHYVGMAVAECDNEEIIERIICADPKGSWEGANLTFTGVTDKPSPAFMNVCSRLRSNLQVNLKAMSVWRKFAGRELDEFVPARTDAFEEGIIEKGMEIVRRLGMDVKRDDFMLVESLGASLYGAVFGGMILISRNTVDKGHRFFASTLYEELMHFRQKYADHTRELQSALFERLIAMTERVMILEGRRLTDPAVPTSAFLAAPSLPIGIDAKGAVIFGVDMATGPDMSVETTIDANGKIIDQVLQRNAEGDDIPF